MLNTDGVVLVVCCLLFIVDGFMLLCCIDFLVCWGLDLGRVFGFVCL